MAKHVIMPGFIVRSIVVDPILGPPPLLYKLSERVSVMAWGGFMIFLSESPIVMFTAVREVGKKLFILILLPEFVIERALVLQTFSQKSPEDARVIEATFHPAV